MDKKQIKCKACGTVLSNIYGSVEDPQLAPENGNSKELYPNNKNDMACYFCGPACVSKFTSMTKWNGDKGIDGLNDYTDGNESKASEVVKDKYGNSNLIIDVARHISQKSRDNMKDSDFLYPKTRSYPIKTAADVKSAISAFGRGKNGDSYDTFIHKLWNKAKSLGLESAIPESTRKEHNLS